MNIKEYKELRLFKISVYETVYRRPWRLSYSRTESIYRYFTNTHFEQIQIKEMPPFQNFNF